MEKKNPIKSKTIQANTIAIILSYSLSQMGYSIPGEVQIAVLSVTNVVLRAITKGAIGFSE